jgi:hypothetical protein
MTKIKKIGERCEKEFINKVFSKHAGKMTNFLKILLKKCPNTPKKSHLQCPLQLCKV